MSTYDDLHVLDLRDRAHAAGFDDVDEYRQWLRLDGRRQLVLALREELEFRSEFRGDTYWPLPVERFGGPVGGDRDLGERPDEDQDDTVCGLDVQPRSYPSLLDLLDLAGQFGRRFRVRQVERAARVVQSVLRHDLAPSSVGPDRSVEVPPVAVEEAAAGGTAPHFPPGGMPFWPGGLTAAGGSLPTEPEATGSHPTTGDKR